MCFYFCSEQNGEIKALTGTKSIVINKSDAHFLKNKLGFNYEDRVELTRYIRGLFVTTENNRVPKYFEEELDHYKHLSKSVTSNGFYLANILLRFSFSSINKKLIEEMSRKALVDRQIIRYYRRYAKFHYLTSPILESSYQLAYETEGSIIRSPSNSSSIDYWFDFLMKETNSNEELEKFTSRFIDSVFHNKSNKPVSKDKLVPKFVVAFHVYLKFLIPLFWNKQLYPVLWGSFRKLRLTTFTNHTLKRLFPFSSKKNMSSDQLPGMQIGDITVDPVGFSINQPYIKSQEVHLDIPQKNLNDLYWSILARVASNYQILIETEGSFNLMNHYKRYREFVFSWITITKNASFQLADFDNEIIVQVEELYKKNKTLSDTKLVKVSQSIYEWWNNEYEDWWENKSLVAGFGAYYLQV